GQINTFVVDANPQSITTGPDGALWFTNVGDYPVGRLSTDGDLTTFSPLFTDPPMLPGRITRGPEDNLWFTTFDGGIWRLNLAGTMEEILPLDASEAGADITTGPDGRMWFTQQMTNRIGRLDSLAFLGLNIADGGPLGLAHAPDDSIWFT